MERRDLPTQSGLKGEPVGIKVTKVGSPSSGLTDRELRLEQQYGLRDNPRRPAAPETATTNVAPPEAPVVIPTGSGSAIVPEGLAAFLPENRGK